MKLGVKTFDNPKFLKYFENKADFFEIMASQKVNYSFLKDFSLPMVIHAEHMGFNMNPADKTKKDINLKSINYAIKIANLANSKKIIFHPGVIENKNCSFEEAVSFINNIQDERIIIENLPLKEESSISLCSTPKNTKKLLKETGKGFCFDVNHSILTSIFLKKNLNYFTKEFLKINPTHFHIGGQKIKFPFKDHLSFKNSELNIKEILDLYPKNAEITLETETDIKSVDFDLEYIKKNIKV
jgi:endonuclease IV